MKKLSILLMFIALMACIACQRQQREERKNSEIQREMQERAAEEHQAQEQQHMTQDEAKLNPNEKAPQMISTPASLASPSTSPEKRYRLESQAQKFQPRRIVPMTSPTTETPTPSAEPSPIER
jgi:FKBP-type peptidyl-prolyl cis-trans isomerase